MRERFGTRRSSPRLSAFTLIEVLLVLIILVILGSLAANVFTGTQDKANVKSTIIQIGFIEGAIDRYRLEMNRYPGKLKDLWEEPSDADEAQKWGPKNGAPPIWKKLPRTTGAILTNTFLKGKRIPTNTTSGRTAPTGRMAPMMISATGKTNECGTRIAE